MIVQWSRLSPGQRPSEAPVSADQIEAFLLEAHENTEGR